MIVADLTLLTLQLPFQFEVKVVQNLPYSSKTAHKGVKLGVSLHKIVCLEQSFQASLILCKNEGHNNFKSSYWVFLIRFAQQTDLFAIFVSFADKREVEIAKPFSQMLTISTFPFLYDCSINFKIDQFLEFVVDFFHILVSKCVTRLILILFRLKAEWDFWLQNFVEMRCIKVFWVQIFL